jgi:hypothetical protein
LIDWVKAQDWETLLEKEAVRKAMEGVRQAANGGEVKGDDEPEEEEDARRIKLVVVGDGAVGMSFKLFKSF